MARFTASTKQQELAGDELIQATQERVKAEQLLLEAARKLFAAERILDDALLFREGWVKSTPEPRSADFWVTARRHPSGQWTFGNVEKWSHPSGFEITRTDQMDGKSSAWVCYWVRLPAGLAATRFIPTIAQDSLEATLEWWRLKLINMGRYPESPTKGLFKRLRER